MPGACQAFSQQVSYYVTLYTNEHASCLAQNKPDRPPQPAGSPICTRNRCQALHDIVYGNGPRSAKFLQQQVQSCYQSVTEYQAEQARIAAIRQQELQQAQQSARALQNMIAQQAAASQQAADAAPQQYPANAPAQADAASAQPSRATTPSITSQPDQKPQTSSLADPLANSRSTGTQEPATNGGVADPFSSNENLINPFANSDQSNADVAGENIVDPFASKESSEDRLANSDQTNSDASTQKQINNDLVDPFADKEQGNPADPDDANLVASEVKDYVSGAMKAWGKVDGSKDFSDFATLPLDALQAANTAAGGQFPSTLPGVDELAGYVDHERTVLDALAQKTAGDWMNQSGINAFDPSTTSAAQVYLDAWSQRLATLQQLNQQLEPVLSSAQSFFGNDDVAAARIAALENTMPGIDGVALGDIIADLDACSTQIKAIQAQIQTARAYAGFSPQ
jgi:hypothetical protein